MFVRSQAMHLSFGVLSRSMLVAREPHRTPRGRGRPHYLYPLGKSSFGAAWGHLRGGRFSQGQGHVGWFALPSPLVSDVHTSFSQ